jgi:large conductance mechanosensitive channel
MRKEFKEFAMKGNMLDMAIGIVIGAAFGAIISSLVDDVIMPPIGLLLGGVDFSQMFVLLKGEGDFATIQQAQEVGAVTWNLGLFINAIIKFLIIVAALFMVVKGVNAMRKQEEEAPAEPAAPPEDVVLLTEIRDLLKK